MHLQSLELIGFKSFADKTVFNFHEGVTAIVGPNGCGKSNVLDAVRWVLGEQSAKALRGGEMADVIFNGTDTRKPVGIAEVSLTFSDCAEELDIDWHDVRVTRRVYRDGQSEYLLNKTPCRLRDIHSLFADTGVGRSAYSMMEQGKIDLILSSRPEDRRAIFEEAAGITKYKSQKREALRKLEATEANLLRLGDIIKEVKRQIGSLQRQAGKARRYQALMADLQILDTHHSRRQLDAFEAELAQSQQEIARLEKLQSETGGEIEKRENDVAERRAQLEELDRQINEARSEAQRLENQISAHRNRIEFNRERTQELSLLIERYQNDIETAETKRARQETEIQQTDALLEEIESLLASRQKDLTKLTERTAKLREERIQRERELQELELTISKAENRVATLEEEISGTTARRVATQARLSDLATSSSEAVIARDGIQSKLAAIRSDSEQQQKAHDQLAADVRMAEEQLNHEQEAFREAEKTLAAIDRTIAEKQSKLDVLQQLDDEGEGLAQGSQAVLKGLDHPHRIRPALIGALAALIEVDEEYIRAIEAALGRNLHAIVLQNGDVVAEIIASLTNQKLGQTALILPEFLKAAREIPNWPFPKDAIGRAIDKVHAPPELQPVVRQLLGDVVIAADLPQALRLKTVSPELSVATLSGEFISAEGVVYGGRVSEQSNSLFERKAQVSALSADCRELLATRENLQAKQSDAQEAFDLATKRLEDARERQQKSRVDEPASTVRLTAIERELHESEREVDTINWEKATLDQQLEAAANRITRLEHDLHAQRALLDQQLQQRSATQAAVEAARLRDDQLAEQVNELRLSVATERQRHENLTSQRQPMTARQIELAELITARRADIENYQERRKQQASESSAAEAAIEVDTAKAKQIEASVAESSTRRALHSTKVNALEAEHRSARKSLSDLHDARGKQEVRQTQLQLRIENLTEHVSHRYQVNLGSFVSDRYAFTKTLRAQLRRREKTAEVENAEIVADESSAREVDESELMKIIAELTRQLDSMGPVNLDAVQEYDELEERQRFLETQNNDLTASRRELLEVIARINDTTRKLFADTFAQVRINFREMFAELFGGGRADLLLFDENDPLECGIEITAKPPGKQLQSVSLLSGGERTMTAVALLFAIYMVRPSPFCILDEVDAALDESSINSFIHVLERFVRQSQFIIITHNKRTIAKADVLYGVTMEERGISKLVGMKLTDPRAAASQSSAKIKQNSTQRQLPLTENGTTEREESLALTR